MIINQSNCGAIKLSVKRLITFTTIRLKKDWFSGQKIIYTVAQPIMQESKEFWKMLLLLSSTTRCNRAGAGVSSNDGEPPLARFCKPCLACKNCSFIVL